MAINKNIGSITYAIPVNGARGWGSDVTNVLARLCDVANQVVTANYILTTDNFFRDSSGMFGLKANFLKGVGAIASEDGFIRMASPHANPGQGELFPGGTPEGRSYTYLSWRNSLNNADLHLFPNADNATLKFAGVDQVNLDAIQSLSNKFLDSTNSIDAATIPDGAITNIKVSNVAAIDLGKLAPQAINSAAEFGPTGYLQASNTTTTQLSYLVGVTSNIQTQLNTKVTANANITAGTATKITYDVKGLVTAGTSLVAADIPTGISALNIGAGGVDNTEFSYLDGVTSAIQTQLNTKQGTGAYITALSGDVTASGPGSAAATIAALAVTTGKINDLAVTDIKLNNSAVTTAKIQDLAVTSAKVATGLDAVKIGAGTVSNTVFGYLAGVTSAIQTQIDAKIPAAILTAKGDLLTRNSTVNTNLAVGTNGQYLKADSTATTGLAWADIVAGGSGEKNYIGNPNSSTNWVPSNAAQMTVGTEPVQTNLPDNATQLTGLRFTRISGTAYVYYRFTLDAVDYNKKLKIVKDMKFAGAANDYRVEVYSNTASNYTGTSTQLTVAAPNLPGNYTGQYSTTFDSSGSTAPYIEVRVVGVAGTTPLYINNFLVGPGVLGQVPAISGQITYTPAPIGFGTVSGVVFEYRQVVSKSHIAGKFLAGAGSGVQAQIPLPANQTVGTFGGVSGTFAVGKWALDATAATQIKQGVLFATTGQTYLTLGFDDYTTARAPSNMLNGSNLVSSVMFYIDGEAVVPIAEWAGSGVVNMGAGAQVEYAYNTGVWDATDTTSFATGPQGAAVGGTLTGNRVKRVRFSTPIQQGDMLKLEYFITNRWIEAEYIYPYLPGSAVDFGSTLGPVAGTTTDMDVSFLQYKFPATYNNATGGVNWTSGPLWRVKKATPSSPVGFGLATATDSGLVSGESSGSFNVYLKGGAGGDIASGTAFWYRVGRQVSVTLPTLTGVSTTTSYTLSTSILGSTNLWPINLTPAREQIKFVGITSNGTVGMAAIRVNSAGVVQLFSTVDGSNSGWLAASGTKGIPLPVVFDYTVA